MKKPELGETVIFMVDKSVEHKEEDYITIKPAAVRGEDRQNIAINVIANQGGSSKPFYEAEMGKEDPARPPEYSLRRVVSEFKNKDPSNLLLKKRIRLEFLLSS